METCNALINAITIQSGRYNIRILILHFFIGAGSIINPHVHRLGRLRGRTVFATTMHHGHKKSRIPSLKRFIEIFEFLIVGIYESSVCIQIVINQ